MQNVQFDAFGEPVSDELAQPSRQPLVSKRLMLTAVGFYWALVAVLVVARAYFFDPDFAGKIGRVEAFARNLLHFLVA